MVASVDRVSIICSAVACAVASMLQSALQPYASGQIGFDSHRDWPAYQDKWPSDPPPSEKGLFHISLSVCCNSIEFVTSHFFFHSW